MTILIIFNHFDNFVHFFKGPTAPVQPLVQPEALMFVRETIIPASVPILPEEIIVDLFPPNFPLLNKENKK